MEQGTDALLALIRAVVRSGLVGRRGGFRAAAEDPCCGMYDRGRRHMRSSIEWRGECVSGKWETSLLPIERGEGQGAFVCGVVEASSSRLFRTGRRKVPKAWAFGCRGRNHL